QRPSIYTLSQKQWDNYVNAIYKLNNGTRPTKWDKLSQLHQSIYSSIHSKASFFSWHRAFLFVLERELQNIDPSVVIPYWDWTNYSQNPENDPVFASRRFGGNGVPSNNNQIDDGSFANFKVYGGNNVHLLKRSFNQIDKKMTPWLSPDVINGMILNSKDFKTFWNRVEAGPHGLIHNGIGADFSGHGSPSDPLFYSHHAFVDKLWYTWVKRGNGERDTEYAFDDTVPNLDAKLNSFNITTRDVMDTENNLCYYY
ncbi:Di-copper centre-containing protein, partial [Neoconidiobolus thromboides FSU 785]